MEKFQEHALLAKRAFQTADHLAYVTYPLLKEVKLIITITENLYIAAANLMDTVLEYDRLYKRIDPLVNDFEIRFDVFKNDCAKRHNINMEFAGLILELRNVINSHKKSPMEFTKGDKFIIASQNYQLKTLTIDSIKNYVSKVRDFSAKVDSITK
ncbi:MAG: hypothetical protein AB1571_00025 [Nanoarchaeota archaeon]